MSLPSISPLLRCSPSVRAAARAARWRHAASSLSSTGPRAGPFPPPHAAHRTPRRARAPLHTNARFLSQAHRSSAVSAPLTVPLDGDQGFAAAVSLQAGSAPPPVVEPNTRQLDFDDVSVSFRVKSTWELLRSILVFRMCTIRPFVQNARSLLALSQKLLGHRITEWMLKRTFFGHFCAGETGPEVQRVINQLERSGLGSILDYAAEADIAAVPQPRDRTGIKSARTYDYEGEAECDANAEVCRSCIEAAGEKGDGMGFAAIKLTALGKPELLQHLARIITQTKKLFIAFASDNLYMAAQCSDRHPDVTLAKQISFDSFRVGLKAINVRLSEERTRKLFDAIDKQGDGSIDFIEWVTFLDPRLLGGLAPKFKSEGLPTLNQEELDKLHAMIVRLEGLAELAAKKRVRLMIDAEHSYFQPAIDHLVLDLQRKYNRGDFPVIWNTYQAYLKDSNSRLLVDLERASREGFKFAAKAVRGAYMVQERKRAKEKKYTDPILPNIQATHDNFHSIVSTLVRNRNAEVLVATHNENSVRFTTELMSELNIPRRGGGVFFGQLLGMCDHVSFSLGHCGYAVYKYVPYGPVNEVIPYLVRRAEENSDMLGGATKERKLLMRELWRRIKKDKLRVLTQ